MVTREEISLGNLVNVGARLLRRLADARLKPLGLSSGYLPVVNALIAAPNLSQKALAEIASIEQPTMAATLARMERDLIIRRQPDLRDGRSSLYSLTPATCDKVGKLKAEIEAMSADALADFSDEERAAFRRMLLVMIASLERALAA